MSSIDRRLSRLAAPALAAALFYVFSGAAHALPRHAAMVIDANTGAVMHDYAGDEPRHPASLTKMMTLYIAFDLIEQGRLSYGAKIEISPQAAAVAPSKLDLDPGSEITMIDAIKALITKSANDVAVAIAEEVSGSEAAFAQLMTARARQIGMSATTFKNASGLPDPEQVTTARDMLTLALRLEDDFPKHYALFKTLSFSYAGHVYRNHNTLLRSFQGTDGIKTGYTRDSGFNLVSSVKRDGKHLVAAIFGGHSAPIRNANMRMLLTKTLDGAATEKTRKVAAIPPMAPLPRLARPRTVAQSQAKTAAPILAAAPPAETKPAETRPEETRVASNEPPASAVAIAKVRQVLVKTKPAAPPTTEESFGAPPPAPKLFATAAASGPGAAAVKPKAKPRVAPAKTPAPEVAARQPGTLERQAALAANMAPPPKDGGGYHVQIGAFASPDEAERQLGVARAKAGAAVSGHPAVTRPVETGDKKLYRARFAGFDASGAASACAALKKQEIVCLVLKAE